MNARLAKKILKTILLFQGFVSNYQPYSISQQRKALKVAGRNYSRASRESIYKNIPIPKVPNKFRKSYGYLPDEF